MKDRTRTEIVLLKVLVGFCFICLLAVAPEFSVGAHADDSSATDLPDIQLYTPECQAKLDDLSSRVLDLYTTFDGECPMNPAYLETLGRETFSNDMIGSPGRERQLEKQSLLRVGKLKAKVKRLEGALRKVRAQRSCGK